MTDAGGHAWGRTYDAKRRLTGFSDPLGNTVSLAYDAMGRVTSLTDPSGNRTSYTYSPMGQVASVSDPLGRTTSYAYDGRGYLSGITSADGSQVLVERNALGQATKITGPNGSVWDMEFNAQGQLTSHTDPLENRWSRTYDNRNRLAQVVLPGDAGPVSLAYDAKGNLLSKNYPDGTQLNFTYNAKNRLVSAGNVAMERDANSNITNANGLAVTRDPGGRITAVALAPGKSVAYGYDANGNLVQVTDWLGNTTTMTYDAASRLLSLVRPNGIVTTYTYDANSRITAIADAKDGPLSTISLDRDDAGNIASAQRNVPLTAGALQGSQAWQINAAGQVVGFNYDPLGRLTSDMDRTFSWDLASRLTGLSAEGQTTTFVYDDLHRVVSRNGASGSESFVWNYAFVLPAISVTRSGGADSRYYIHTPAGDLLYFIDNADGQAHYYHYDEMGSALFLTDQSGSITDRYAYTPYGEMAGSTGQTPNPFTFIGRYGVIREGDTGLYRMHRRLYDSRTKRFISPDPIMDFNNPSGLIPYLYAAGNPLRYIDPTGEANEDKAGQAPIPDSVSVAKEVHDKGMMIVGKMLEDAADRSADVAEIAERMNSLNKTFGKQSPEWMKTALNHAEALKTAQNMFDMAGDVSQGFGLALDTYERGPEAIVEYGAGQAAEKVVGKKVMAVYNIVNEGFSTRERVHDVVNEEKSLNDANLSSLYKLLNEVNRSYFKEKSIDKDQYERLVTNIQQGFNMSVEGTTDSGYWGVAKESVEGLKNMLESFIGM
jgi:RHS repeat-associated protein